jgi:hypothetical protein
MLPRVPLALIISGLHDRLIGLEVGPSQMTSLTRGFISGTTAGLQSHRVAVREVLEAMGVLPVEQTSFPPDHKTVVNAWGEDRSMRCCDLSHRNVLWS